jgi:hypothetical protein
MRHRVTIRMADFKKAILQDGNLKQVIACGNSGLLYVTRQIDSEKRLTAYQRDSLYNWAHEKFGA